MALLIWMNGLNDGSFSENRDLKQQRRRQLLRRHLKIEFALLETLSRLFHLVQFVKCWQIFLELNSLRLYRSSGKEKESRCLVFLLPTQTILGVRHAFLPHVRRAGMRDESIRTSAWEATCVHVLYKTWNQAFSRRNRAMTANKRAWCTCKIVVLLIQTYCFFAVTVAFAMVVV